MYCVVINYFIYFDIKLSFYGEELILENYVLIFLIYENEGGFIIYLYFLFLGSSEGNLWQGG